MDVDKYSDPKKTFSPIRYGPRHEKTCLRWFAKYKGPDQPTHPRSLISAFIINFSESIISKLATSKIPII